jgi:hypothetical protein
MKGSSRKAASVGAAVDLWIFSVGIGVQQDIVNAAG